VTTETHQALTAAFASRGEAERAVAALRASGISPSAVELREAPLPPIPQREGRYLWRLLVIIVLWSVLGGVFGVLVGLVLWATIGPEGMNGLIFQAVCWGIVGHLVVGMIAGYVVLADRSEREMEPERPEVVVTVLVPEPQLPTAYATLRESGAKRVTVSGGSVTSRP
jgi:hypothetical protein